MLSCRVLESLQKFVEASLLQSFDIVFDLGLKRQLVLIEVNFVARSHGDKFVVVEELG